MSLFGYTGQSNVSNHKPSLDIIKYASALGYHTLLDAAALVPTSTFSLAEFPVDAMAISFYKMFGFPTGVGALVVKTSFLGHLRRPWFSGGSVNVVQVPGSLVTMSTHPHERFEVSLDRCCTIYDADPRTRTAQSTTRLFLLLRTAFAFSRPTSLSCLCDSPV